MNIPAADDIRNSRVAGLFYSDDEVQLRSQISDFFEAAETIPDIERIFGLVAPHAGYTYSGRTAAGAYRQIWGKSFDTVAIVAPSHREYFDGVSVFTGRCYSTPLGDVETDREIARLLIEKSDNVHASWSGHRDEHALEVQLPFLQTALTGFRIVPLVMGEQKRENVEKLASALSEVQRSHNMLLVASSDLSHFHSSEEAHRLDKPVLEGIEMYDHELLWENFNRKKCEACGAGPILSVMLASKYSGATRGKVLGYTTSGEVTGDKDQVVGYMSAMFCNPRQ